MTEAGLNSVAPGDGVTRAILLRYHEIALKGGNRGWFEKRLAQNASKLLERSLGMEAARSTKVTRQHGRVLVHAPWNGGAREALDRLFGLSSFSPMRSVPTSLEEITRVAIEEMAAHIRAHGLPPSFCVRARRSDKALPEKSTELDRMIGGAVHNAIPGLRVDLSSPAVTLGIEVRFKNSYVWVEKIKGLGGLPVGTNGRVLALISGGLDSPVAAINVLRRGAPVSFVHFHGTPFVGDEVLDKIEDLVRLVNRYQPVPEPLYVVPFGKIQERMALATQPKLRTVLYRRMMVRVASRLAHRLRARALVTGEAIGQVASQTIENMVTIDAASPLPILRPLVAFDKDEIVAAAQRWGTFETSIRPADDCCTLFADRHPAIRATHEAVAEEEAKVPIDDLVEECLRGAYQKGVRLLSDTPRVFA